MVELLGLARGERDVSAEPAVRRLAQALSLPEERLLELAGYGQPAASLPEAAVRFAARWEPVQQWSTEKQDARLEFVPCLAKRQDEWKGSGVLLRGEATANPFVFS